MDAKHERVMKTHHKHLRERHDLHAKHSQEHAELAHRQAKEIEGAGGNAPATALGAAPDAMGPNTGQGAIPGQSPAPAPTPTA